MVIQLSRPESVGGGKGFNESHKSGGIRLSLGPTISPCKRWTFPNSLASKTTRATRAIACLIAGNPLAKIISNPPPTTQNRPSSVMYAASARKAKSSFMASACPYLKKNNRPTNFILVLICIGFNLAGAFDQRQDRQVNRLRQLWPGGQSRWPSHGLFSGFLCKRLCKRSGPTRV